MHILIIPSWYPDETVSNDVSGIFFKELAEEYAAQGHNVKVLAHLVPFPLHPYKLKKFVSRRSQYTINGVQTFNVKFLNWSGYRHIDESSSIKSALNWFRKYIRKYGKPDIIHAHSTFNGGVIALEINKRYSIPFYISEHGSWFIKEMKPELIDITRHVFQKSNRFTAVGSVLLDKLIEKLNVDSKFGSVIPNILPNRFLKMMISEKKNDKFIFLNIALDGKNKCRDILLKAFALSFGNSTEIELWIGGTDLENEEIVRLSKELKIEKQVKLLGLLSRDQVHQAMADCNVFVLSSEVETFGIVLIEALSQGKPIISTDSGGPRDIVNKKNGLLVSVNDQDALAKAMKQIKFKYNNYNFEYIRKECIDNYGAPKVIQKYIQLYNQ